jgi:hypothetical protein
MTKAPLSVTLVNTKRMKQLNVWPLLILLIAIIFIIIWLKP